MTASELQPDEGCPLRDKMKVKIALMAALALVTGLIATNGSIKRADA